MKNIRIFEYAAFSSQNRDGPPGTWLFLGYSYRILKELRSTPGLSGKELPLADELDRSCPALRQPFVEYVGSLTTDEGPHPTFCSGLVERVPFRSSVFLDICLIDAALRIIRWSPEESFTVICEHRGLAYDLYRSIQDAGDLNADLRARGPVQSLPKKIAAGVRIVLHAGKISAQLLYRRGFRSRSPSPEAGRGLVILHTWVAQASIASWEYREMFFGDLREHLRALGHPVVLMPHVPYDVAFPETLAALDRQQAPFFTEESSLSRRDILATFLAVVRDYPRWSEHRLSGISFSHAAYTQAFRDWQSLQLLIPSVSARVIRGMAARQVPVKALIFTYENNAWEKALVKSLRECYPRAICTGYQHSTTTPNFLYYYLSRAGTEQKFLPDRIVTNGEYPASFLKQNNFPADRVVAGGALRYISGRC
ncbi:MAG TPA: hypothetical protein VMT44_07690, partial [Methanoregula sp.]|nr:hypothetical protein [Methanoregula sp.]